MKNRQAEDELVEVLGYESYDDYRARPRRGRGRALLLIGVILVLQLLVLGTVSIIASMQSGDAAASGYSYEFGHSATLALQTAISTVRLIVSAIIRR